MNPLYADLAFFFCILLLFGYLFYRRWTDYRIAIEQERTRQKEWETLAQLGIKGNLTPEALKILDPIKTIAFS